jgi:hypothetical protein
MATQGALLAVLRRGQGQTLGFGRHNHNGYLCLRFETA